ncbi:hypothetical protein COB47_0250 [Caldicellulosiruptor obsidiansis OB47]|uniref:Uncharacterized protein n=1 Tax=Caldicellulosiruptor obsidiansis (strain ATCC BAA-2073 / JCM 16842 / OB47) TaxID=608506 RepID=D9THX1_CALOO|nr:hypothetical protein [Caldicellulosiruptor obsidiansis]ADL41603.1 hypothetical protein COB47_0250 [Caldicellulosiruptor obsidiansis OB47]
MPTPTIDIEPKIKRILALIVCISFILTFLPINSVSFAKPRYDVWKDKIKVYDADEKFKRAEAEYEGYKYIATFDEDTNEIKLKVKPIATKKFDKSLDSSSLNEERNFSVKVEYFDGENLKAKLIDEKTKEEYNIGDSDTVSAQYVIALPTVLGLLEELLYILLGAAGIVFVGGATYYLAEKLADKIRNSSYDYFLAYISNDKKLYVGPAVDFSTAKAIVLDRGDIFARRQDLAYKLAKAVSEYAHAGIRHDDKPHDSDDPNYFPHYHIIFNPYSRQPHIFYPY